MKSLFPYLFVVFVFTYYGYSQSQIGQTFIGEGTLLGIGDDIDINENGSRILISGSSSDGGVLTYRFQVYEYNATNWVEMGQEIIEVINANQGKSVTLNDAGTRLAIGLPAYNGDSQSNGKVKIYDFNGVEWIQMGSDLIGSQEFGFFGSSLSFNEEGNIIAVGESGLDSYKGAVKMFQFVQDDWEQLGNAIVGDEDFDRFGLSCDLSGNGLDVVVGAIFNDNNGMSSGQMKVYTYDGNSWTQKGESIFGEQPGTQMGTSVGISFDGNRIAGGGKFNDNASGASAGHVRLYDFIDSDWTQVGNDINGDTAGEQSGTSIGLSATGNRLIIGSPIHTGDFNFTGQVRVFQLDEGEWTQLGSSIEGGVENERLGEAVAMSKDGNRFIVGSPQLDEGFGGVKVYDLSMNQSPSAFCQDIQVELNESGSINISAEDIDNGSFDMESDVILSISIDSFTCSNLGENEVVLTVEDDFGETDSCAAMVTVVDMAMPVIECLDDVVVEDNMTGFYELEDYIELVSDNCSFVQNGSLIFNQTPAPGTNLQAGTTTLIELQAIDQSNNVSNCSFNIMVEETLGLTNSNLGEKLNIYPNPFSDQTQVTIQNDSIESITVYDILGNIIKNTKVKNDLSTCLVDLEYKPSGIYFLKIETTKDFITRRVIKN